MEPVFFTERFHHPVREDETIELHVTAWGKPGNPLAFCLHGLTRNGRDFDRPAQMLAEMGFYVLCPDMPGRGASDKLPHPEDYQLPIYVGILMQWLLKLGNPSFGILGTSMGGMIAMSMAPLVPQNLTWVVLNDVGSIIDYAGLKRISAYVGEGHFHPTRESAERIMLLNLSTWALPDAEATGHFLKHSVMHHADGRYSLAFDPAIAAAFKLAFDMLEEGQPIDLSAFYAQLTCPVLVVRGEKSDLLTAQTALAMQAARPGQQTLLHTVPGAGHAPSLWDMDTLDAIKNFAQKAGQSA
jgi:pimeloyl-ACP methyl ester carboxylesterase